MRTVEDRPGCISRENKEAWNIRGSCDLCKGWKRLPIPFLASTHWTCLHVRAAWKGTARDGPPRLLSPRKLPFSLYRLLLHGVPCPTWGHKSETESLDSERTRAYFSETYGGDNGVSISFLLRTTASWFFRGQGFFAFFSEATAPPHRYHDLIVGQRRPSATHGEGRFLFGEDRMNCFKNINCALIALISLFLLPGCALPSRSPATPMITASLAYDVPGVVDGKTVVDILEETSSKTLGRPVTIDDTTFPLIATGAASPIILQEKVASLKGLGEVIIPSIICPGALASMHTLMPGKPGLLLIAGCVIATNHGTRIYLAEAAAGKAADGPFSHEAIASSVISRIGTALAKRLPEIYPVDGPRIPIHRTTGPNSATGGPPSDDLADDLARAKEADAADRNDRIVHATPVVCFAPKEKDPVVREYPGSDGIAGTLNSDLIVQEEDIGKDSFLHVTTREGRVGWIKRSDVRWALCPIA